MSRYGWSLNRKQSSPYSSTNGDIPPVTDEDFSYITTKDLEDHSYFGARPVADRPLVEDDVLLIKNKGVTYPAHFPAFAIGDGKLRVKDVRDRIGLLMELSERATRRMKLLYKGRRLKDPAARVRDYGVKNKSELMAILADMSDESSASEEEMVIVKDNLARSKKRKNRKRSGMKKSDSDSASNPRDSTSCFDGSSPTSGADPIKRLDELSDEFNNNLHPLCKDYIASPPSDPAKRHEEYRKLSETIFQNILLKLDEVETNGVAEVRARRKEVVNRVQEVLKALDAAKAN